MFLYCFFWFSFLSTTCLLCRGATLRRRSSEDHSTAYEETCNGRRDLCHLRFDEVTLLGSHNSMAFDFRVLAGLYSPASLNCAYADHSASEKVQLDRGVRMLDYDVCLRNGKIYSCHGEGELARVKRLLEDDLTEVAAWLDDENHRDDVIMISFGDHDPRSETEAIAAGIAQILDDVFHRHGQALPTSEARFPPNPGVFDRRDWPTLGAMVASNRRVVLAMEGSPYKPKNNLYKAVPSSAKEYIFNLFDDFEYTWSGANEADEYRELLSYMKYYCEETSYLTRAKAVHFDAFMSLQLKLRKDPKAGHDRIARRDLSEFYLANVSGNDTGAEEDDAAGFHLSNVSMNNSGSACFCNACMAKKFNEAMTRKRGVRQTSSIDEAYRICHKENIRVHVIKIDFEEYGNVQAAVDLMNDHNVQRYAPEYWVPRPVTESWMTNPFAGALQNRPASIAVLCMLFSGLQMISFS